VAVRVLAAGTLGVAFVFLVVAGAEEFFGVPVVVGAGLAAFEMGRRYPFTAPPPTNYSVTYTPPSGAYKSGVLWSQRV
jgi:hypothetical protein